VATGVFSSNRGLSKNQRLAMNRRMRSTLPEVMMKVAARSVDAGTGAATGATHSGSGCPIIDKFARFDDFF
jgi:hypothetical protein